MGSVRTSIIGRPRRLHRDRRAALRYTVNCEEPLYSDDDITNMKKVAATSVQGVAFVVNQ